MLTLRLLTPALAVSLSLLAACDQPRQPHSPSTVVSGADFHDAIAALQGEIDTQKATIKELRDELDRKSKRAGALASTALTRNIWP